MKSSKAWREAGPESQSCQLVTPRLAMASGLCPPPSGCPWAHLQDAAALRLALDVLTGPEHAQGHAVEHDDQHADVLEPRGASGRVKDQCRRLRHGHRGAARGAGPWDPPPAPRQLGLERQSRDPGHCVQHQHTPTWAPGQGPENRLPTTPVPQLRPDTRGAISQALSSLGPNTCYGCTHTVRLCPR